MLGSRGHLWYTHILLTVDVILVDECGQLSSEQWSLLDIILRQMRKSNMPFGGVLVLGTFDHMQIECINGLPFLLSTHLLTDFTIVRLEHSVRAANDEKLMVSASCNREVFFVISFTNEALFSFLQRLQSITRMSPITLRSDTAEIKDINKNGEIFKEWIELFCDIIKVVPSFKEVDPNYVQIFHRKRSAMDAIKMWTDHTKEYLEKYTDVKPLICVAKDKMKYEGTSQDWNNADKMEEVVNMLDSSSKVKEPKCLMLFPGCLYEVTRNNKNANYFNSQIVILLDVPSKEHIDGLRPLTMYACPCGKKAPSKHFFSHVPSEDEVVNDWGWYKVRLHPVKENFVTVNNVVATRIQYAMNHLGASTVSA